jgi:hypothetical protein
MKAILRIQGGLDLFGIIGFLVGFFGGFPILMIAAGLVMVLDDVYQISTGILNPLFPVLSSIVLAVVLEPWYVGVFWAAAFLRPLGIPGALIKLFNPEAVIARLPVGLAE